MGGSLPEMMKPRKPVIHLTAVMPSLLDLHQQRSDLNEDAEWSPSLTPQGIGIDVDPWNHGSKRDSVVLIEVSKSIRLRVNGITPTLSLIKLTVT